MILTDALFLICVNRTHIQSAIMLPNTKHITNPNQRIHINNKMNDVIAFHGSKKITTARMAIDGQGVEQRIGMYIQTDKKPESIKSNFFEFQKCRKRYNRFDLMNDHGDISENIRQKEYLQSHLISHAWVALHRGHVVGLITFPLIKNSIQHDIAFERYKSLARQALQLLGNVVSCDIVLDQDNQLQIYNIHNQYEVKGKLIPYFTRKLPLTSHLKFNSQIKIG